MLSQQMGAKEKMCSISFSSSDIRRTNTKNLLRDQIERKMMRKFQIDFSLVNIKDSIKGHDNIFLHSSVYI